MQCLAPRGYRVITREMAGSLFCFTFPNQTSSENAVHEIPEMLQLRTQSVITESTSTSEE